MNPSNFLLIRVAIVAWLFFVIIPDFFAQQDVAQKIDSLERMLAKGNLPDDELFDICLDISRLYDYAPQKAVLYAKRGIILAEKANNKKIIPDLYQALAGAYYSLDKLDSSLLYCEKIIELYSANGAVEQQALGIALRIAGLVHTMQGHHEEALVYLYRSIEMAEKIDNKVLLAQIYSNIAYLYAIVNNTELAENYFVKMGNTCIETGDSLNLAYSLYQLSNVYTRRYEHGKALQYAEEAYRIVTSCHNAGRPDYLIEAVITLSDTWRYYDHNEVLKYAKEALALTEKYNIPSYKPRVLHSIAKSYYIQKNYTAAEDFAFQAIKEADAQGDDEIKNYLYDVILLSNIKLGNTDKAIEYFELYRKWMIDFSQQTFNTSFTEMEVKYETEKKETQIATLQAEKRLMIWLGIVGGFVLLLALATSLSLWRWTVQKRRFSEQRVIQLQQEKQLVATQAVLDGEVQERSRLARDLHDGLGSILAAAKYNLADAKKAFIQEVVDMECFDKAMNLLDESIHEMRRVAHHLMPESLSSHGLKQSVADFCNSVSNVKFSYYGDETRFDPKLEVMIYRIMHELVSNALKHSRASHILVEIVRYDDHIALTVQDDGCGFDPSTVSKGMGLANIRTRVAAYNGNLLVDSKEGVGTEVNVELRHVIMNYEL